MHTLRNLYAFCMHDKPITIKVLKFFGHTTDVVLCFEEVDFPDNQIDNIVFDNVQQSSLFIFILKNFLNVSFIFGFWFSSYFFQFINKSIIRSSNVPF